MYAHIYAGRKKKLIEEMTQNEIRAQVVDDLLHNSPIPIDIVFAQARRGGGGMRHGVVSWRRQWQHETRLTHF